jgi:peptidoglycan/LPS O-acetylase OafA/YrhL
MGAMPCIEFTIVGNMEPQTAPKVDAALRVGGYLPTLDGWRAVAILAVLLAHAPTLRLGRISTAQFHFAGDFGVEIFFALSGLLICTRLLEEERLTGSLHLKNFYIRRLFRIQPPALAYLGLMAVLMLLHRIPVFKPGFFGALLLVRNYVGVVGPIESVWSTAHYWSLSVEEHFYLFLPSLLLVTRRFRASVLFGLGLLSFAWRLYLLHQPGRYDFADRIRTDTSICFLFIPSCIAVLLQDARGRGWAVRYLRAWWVVPVTLLFLPDHFAIHPFRGIIASGVVVATLLHPKALLSRILETTPLRFIGRLSYSLYIWQEILLTGYFAPKLRPFGALHQPLLVWPAVFVAALLSYYLLERPAVRLGHRIAGSAVKGRPQ